MEATGRQRTELEMFPLLDLPWEVVEQLVGYLPTRDSIHLSMCSHRFKELTACAHYWQNLIQKEKKKVLYVSPDVTGMFYIT